MRFNSYIKEIDISNIDDVPDPLYIKKYDGYIFTVDGVEFIFKGTKFTNNEWIIKFGVHKGGSEMDISMTNKYESKNTILILKNVIKCLKLFTKKYTPNKITLVADTKSKQNIYKRIYTNLMLKKEWQYYGSLETKKSDTDDSIVYIINKKGYISEGVLDDVLSFGSKFLYFWKNKWIINTAHGLERIIQRNKLTISELKLLFKEAIEKAIELGVHTGEEILFWSKSLKQGFVSTIDPQGNIKLITFLPKGKHQPKSGTEHIVVEGKQIRIIEID